MLRTSLRGRLAALSLCAFAFSGHAQTVPASVAQLYREGAQAFASHDLALARKDLEQVVQEAPGFETGHSALGVTLLSMGDRQGGIRELERALALKPSDTQVELNLGHAYLDNGNSAKSAAAYAHVVSLERAAHHAPDSNVLHLYAVALQRSGDGAGAVEVLKELVARNPNSAEAYDELGAAYAAQRQWQPALENFHHALVLSPQNESASRHLASAEHDSAEQGQAPESAEESVDQLRLQYDKTKSPRAAYRLGLALQQENKSGEALPYLEAAARGLPASGDAQTNYGMALCQAQRAKEAVPVLKRGVALQPKSATARQDLAVAYIQLSQYDDAASELSQALRFAPDSMELHYNLGFVYKMKDDPEHAIPELRKAEMLNAAAPEPGYALGVLYLQQGKYADAEKELRSSLNLQPDNAEGWATLGSVETDLGKLPEAEDALKKAIEQQPDKSDSHLTLASVYAKQGKAEDAAAERHRAAELMRTGMNQQRSEVSARTGQDLLDQGKLSEAQKAFEDSIRFNPANKAAHLGLASTLERSGSAAEAANEREKASQLQ